ncbi:ureidoglycolate lyase [Variibacter gotjawalensis]|uniref:Ureidoglycolate lyase n=1 Tax=Variibacter gotjawalensis TaxID=1333996 RepID=A0A0S3PT17_9BRAD|nr:fumarylacetoacetate hydrolase family protein [Variibacter gotjawalensis]NIK49382.1 2-keto-4-pentenoate hydratase/2-oxohepta-3-ene-1,7-dioic acid hydratase in catechol pathway [Variibacter gotjawalensis]RZS51234.1 2-keto-4-pentenoate hydratase/2-oxohepta-3-ene-1,7-dioic acid hydratase in catechol pathway [Variibacter gotjawalensis]BAT59067.1 ureidoglycolate lyase [Variibacter gotjawalensis]
MKIVAFVENGARHLGIIEGDQVVDLQAADSRVPDDFPAILAAGDMGRLGDVAKNAPASARRPLAGIKYALPVAKPGKIICLGLNYLEHAKEGGHQRPQHPSIFLRVTTSLTAHEAPIVRPQASVTLDYECELVLVVGKRMRHATKSNALSCVAGYSCFNDGSVREFQRRTSQWDYGKNFDKTGGFGPWFVSADELPPGAKGLKIETRLNGNVMQSDNTSNMMFPIIETIVDVTQGMTLEPGDLIVTGTPSGVGHARKPPVWMKGGDTVEIDIEGVGVLRNPVVDEV